MSVVAETYWIADMNGVHALADAETRRWWTTVHGWLDAAEPGPDVHVHVANGDMVARMPFGALAAGMADSGWHPCPPPDGPTREQVKSPAPSGSSKKERADG